MIIGGNLICVDRKFGILFSNFHARKNAWNDNIRLDSDELRAFAGNGVITSARDFILPFGIYFPKIG